jgi:hypothetical protein
MYNFYQLVTSPKHFWIAIPQAVLIQGKQTQETGIFVWKAKPFALKVVKSELMYKAQHCMSNDHVQFFKEIMSPVKYLNAYTIKSVLTVYMRKLVFKFKPTLCKIKINKKILLVYWQHLQILKNVPRAIYKFLFRFSFALIGWFFPG